MAQLAEWPAVVTCGRTVEEARAMLIEAAREMIASYGCRAGRRVPECSVRAVPGARCRFRVEAPPAVR